MSNKRKAGVKPKQASPAQIVEMRLDFYKDKSSQFTKLLYASIVSLALSIGLVFYSVSNKVQQVYFATDENGSLLKLVPLGQPNQNNRVVADWLNRALVDIFDMDYVGLDNHLNKSALKWFTKNGAVEFVKKLKQNGYYNAILEQKLSLKLVTNQVPIIVAEKKSKDKSRHIWVAQVPATITFFAQNGKDVGHIDFTVMVSRRSLLEDAIGLGISQMIMKDSTR